MVRPGLRILRCEVCEQEKEIEAGIKVMYCCAEKMEDITEEEHAENTAPAQEEPLRLRRRE